jgi:hypothetical protein
MAKVPKAVQWIAEGLNEYDALENADALVPNHSPASPMFWFHGLARETANGWKSPDAAALLTPTCVARLRGMGIEVAA